MRVTTSKSKNAESFYISKGYVNDKGVSTSVIIRKLGTLKDLLPEHGPTRDDVMVWAKEQARIETLKYKSLLKDIVVIEVEESYTSKTSFIDNEELRAFNKEENKDLTQGEENQLSKNNKKMLGKRKNQKFITKEKKVIHADVNGSYNIVRKVLLNLSYDKEIINLSYELMEVKLNGKKKLYNFHEMKKRINSKIKNKELNSEINWG